MPIQSSFGAEYFLKLIAYNHKIYGVSSVIYVNPANSIYQKA